MYHMKKYTHTNTNTHTRCIDVDVERTLPFLPNKAAGYVSQLEDDVMQVCFDVS